MTQPLTDVVVVDLTWNLPGPYASHLLASLGAQIVKIEPPKGDPARHLPGLFAALNRGKRSVFLDLRSDEGKQTLADEIAQADVVLEGFRPGVAARLGCDAKTVRERHPSIVYCSISAYGQDGPLCEVPGHDLNVQALAGICHLGRDAKGHPHGLPLPVADFSAALSAVASINAALYHRQRTGEGATLDVAMLDGAVSMAAVWSQVDLADQARSQLPGPVRRLAGRWLDRLDRLRLHALPHYETYRCRDGRALAIGIVDEHHFWRALCGEVGLGAWPAGLGMPARAALGPVLKPMLARAFRRDDRDRWVSRLTASGVPVSAVLTPAESGTHPHVAQRLVRGGHLLSPLAGAAVVDGAVAARPKPGP